MNLRCLDGRASMECRHCGARFARDDALVTVAEAERAAECACSADRGCPQWFDRAEALVGATVRDRQGRQWVVSEIGEKDCFPTVSGDEFWDRPEAVTVIAPPAGIRTDES